MLEDLALVQIKVEEYFPLVVLVQLHDARSQVNFDFFSRPFVENLGEKTISTE